ncbi:MAG: OpgC domain-containing protein [Geminicoccaceae bacterium]|nr:OpgC domain-containing protein [Geminicoccaceae bacterium]
MKTTAGGRDPRLDAWRGAAMLIIYVAHIQWNPWSDYIPARFGPSDAAEMFVFCSGYAAAIAFGGTFARAGFWMGTGRILLRCWQIYWAHLGLFFATVAVTAAMTALFGGGGRDFYGGLNLGPFLDDTARLTLGLFTLTYVPNYFDILPMYMVILLLVPVVVALQRLAPWAAAAFCLLLYAAAWAGLDLPAEPWSDRPWYFNPFAWQILFFTGFALGRGWLRPPPASPPLLLLAAAFVLLMVPLSRWQIYEAHPLLKAVHDWVWVTDFKTDEHPLRYLHALALTCLAVRLIRGREGWLLGPWLRPVVTVGQQALAAFLASMTLAWIASILLDLAGRTPLTLAVANLGGLLTVVAVAYVVAWYKSQPWRRVPSAAAA